MKHLSMILMAVMILFVSFQTNLKAQDTLNVRLQNSNDITCTLEMLELKIFDHNVVQVWSWCVDNMTFPPGVKHFSVTGNLHCEWPCFTFRYFDSDNNHSAYSDTVCIDNSFKLLPPLYPAVEKRKK